MQIQDFIREYESKTDEELLRLAIDPSQLTFEANSALLAELRKRKLDPEKQISFRYEEEERKQKVAATDIGKLFVIPILGIGRRQFGEGHYQFDSSSGIEEFTTTIFVVFFWLPLIPTGTYRVSRIKGFRPPTIRVIQKLVLDWKQVMKIWLVMLGILLLIGGFAIFRS